MKEIRLQDLVLTNFKGMNFRLNAAGADIDVYGANATGKTTLADAFAWLLFDKDSLGRSDFEIKNLDSQGEAEHGLEHGVEAELTIDGRVITLKKVYHEVWTKKRGSAQAEYSGNTTDYWVNGVPVQKKDYVSTIAEIVGEESIFRLLTTPTAFPALHWKDGRAILMKVCGDVSDADVIASDPSLAPLTEIIGQRTLDDHKKVVTGRKTEINRELDKIPVRIDEVTRALPDISGLYRKEIEAVITNLDGSVADAKLRLQGIDSGVRIAELSKELQGLRHDIGELENKHYAAGMKRVAELNSRINEITGATQAEERKKATLKADIIDKQAKVGALETQLQALRDKFTSINDETFTDTTTDTCPACGQALPSDRVEEARTKALAQFNQSKAERLMEVETKGKELRAIYDRIKNEIEELHNTLMDLETEYGQDQLLTGLIAERDELKAEAEDYSQLPKRAEMLERIAVIEKQIEDARAGVSQDKEKVRQEIDGFNARLTDAKTNLDKFRQRDQGEARIKELKAQEKLLAAEFERLEKELFLIESFIKAKVSMLTEKINSLFQIARFKLFDVQVNGGIAECCEITVNGIPYNGGLNNAARINAGLDVCRTLSRHYGLVAPVFVDNAESVCELINMDAQVIRLVVSEQDKVLRVETARKRIAA